jgi:hypothetical protein
LVCDCALLALLNELLLQRKRFGITG